MVNCCLAPYAHDRMPRLFCSSVRKAFRSGNVPLLDGFDACSQGMASLTVSDLALRAVYCFTCVTQATEDLLAFTIRYTSGVICAALEEERLQVRGVDMRALMCVRRCV